MDLVSDLALEYHERDKGRNNMRCEACLAAGRGHEQSRKRRKPLKELIDLNTRADLETGLSFLKYDRDAPRTSHGCSACNINLCNEDICWQEHLEAVEQKGFQQIQSKRYTSSKYLEKMSELDDDFR